jgi:hypothetical protein
MNMMTILRSEFKLLEGCKLRRLSMTMHLEEIAEESINGTKRSRKLRPFPSFGLEESLTLARSIAGNNGCKPYSRLSLADSIERSPESSAFRGLIISSAAYD